MSTEAASSSPLPAALAAAGGGLLLAGPAGAVGGGLVGLMLALAAKASQHAPGTNSPILYLGDDTPPGAVVSDATHDAFIAAQDNALTGGLMPTPAAQVTGGIGAYLAALNLQRRAEAANTSMEVGGARAVIVQVVNAIPLVSTALKIIGLPGLLAQLASGQPVMDPLTGAATAIVGAVQAWAEIPGALFSGSMWDRLTPAQKAQYTAAEKDLAAGRMPDLTALAHMLGAQGTKTIGYGPTERVVGGGRGVLTAAQSPDADLDLTDGGGSPTRVRVTRNGYGRFALLARFGHEREPGEVLEQPRKDPPAVPVAPVFVPVSTPAPTTASGTPILVGGHSMHGDSHGAPAPSPTPPVYTPPETATVLIDPPSSMPADIVIKDTQSGELYSITADGAIDTVATRTNPVFDPTAQPGYVPLPGPDMQWGGGGGGGGGARAQTGGTAMATATSTEEPSWGAVAAAGGAGALAAGPVGLAIGAGAAYFLTKKTPAPAVQPAVTPALATAVALSRPESQLALPSNTGIVPPSRSEGWNGRNWNGETPGIVPPIYEASTAFSGFGDEGNIITDAALAANNKPPAKPVGGLIVTGLLLLGGLGYLMKK